MPDDQDFRFHEIDNGTLFLKENKRLSAYCQSPPNRLPGIDKSPSLVLHCNAGDEKMSSSMTIRIPDGLRRQLHKVSKIEGKPASDIVRESLRKYLILYEFRRLREMSIPYAEAQGIFTDEDVFKTFS